MVSPHRGRLTAVALFGCVFLYMFADSLQQTVLPLSLETTGASVEMIGLFVAIPQGIGFLSALPAVAHADRVGRGPITVLNSIVAVVAMLCLAWAATGQPLPWWVIGIVVFGLTRLTVWTCILATLSTTGDPLHMQGINGATQRAAAAIAAVSAAAVIATQAWSWAFLLVAVALLVMTPLAALALRATKPPAVASLPTPAVSFAVAGRLAVRNRPIIASSMVGTSCLVVMLVGNAFFALSLVDSPVELAVAVATLLVMRDLTSIGLGLLFRPLASRVDLGRLILIATVCGATGVAFLAVAPGETWVSVIAGCLQGAAIAWCIGATNLLAVGMGEGASRGAALRIASSTIIPGVTSFALPLVLALALGTGGAASMFFTAAGVIVVLGCAGYLVARTSVSFARSIPAQAEDGLTDEDNATEPVAILSDRGTADR
ncbi:MFS transporter [Microbacterium trichothecenolyticum]|uniref:MFS transporter n=1 Tax=Microbacterium trichothecenolyticum TaxID=69370 RepID=UPI001C6DEA9D|nr:MFS transporter [Microbacterium trichothecenolyticum]MBW9122087.1 MFS transporter [Microbacterium trichothecenolyticum]